MAIWIKAQRKVPDLVLYTIDKILNSLTQQSRFDGAPARPMIQALKAIGQSEDGNINVEHLYTCNTKLLTSINLISVPHSQTEMIDVLCAMVRIFPEGLTKLVDIICPILVEKKLWKNLFVIISTIRRVEGEKSPHFHSISKSDWYCHDVEKIVLESINL